MKIHAVQTAALNASRGKPGFAFFMEQGLGKTLTDLLEFSEQVAEGEVKRHVVVAPNSFKGGWVKEIEKWGFNFHPFIFESGADFRHDQFLKTRFDKPPVLILNYEAIRSQATRDYILKYIEPNPARITFDESIQISTHNSLQTRAALELSKEFRYRRILSGKPFKKGPDDYYPQLRTIGLLNGVNYYQFRNRYCKMGGFRGKQVVGVKDEEGLARTMAGNVFEARKVDWTDLPPKVYSKRAYKMTPEMDRHFNMMMDEFVLFLESGDVVTVEAAITKYIKLAQIQAGFIIDEMGQVHELVEDAKNPRLNALIEFIEDELHGKLAIPYHHRHSGHMLRRALARYQPAWIAGGMTSEEIEHQKDRFNGDSACRIILLQTRASKYGHTILGLPAPEHRCSTMAFFENTYSLDDRSQIEDRPHRHGQTADSMDYIDFYGTEIDYRMTEALANKEDIFQTIRRAVADLAAR